MRISRIAGLLISSAMLGAWSGSAHAQAAPSDDQVQGAAGTGSDTADNNTGITDIIVTAERRSTNVQKTALAITALAGDSLVKGGAVNANSLSNAVPGLNVTNSSPISNIFIRGVGGGVLNSYGDPGVAYNVDGVYIARPFGNLATFYDLDRVEILKGPQGTLYGRNATAGAINIIAKQPTFDWGLTADLQAGNYGDMEGSVAINAPLSETVAVRVAGKVVQRDGYLTNGYNDADSIATRAKILFDSGSAFKIVLSGDYFHQTGKGPGDVPVYANGVDRFTNPDNPWQGLLPSSQGGPASVAVGPGVPRNSVSVVGSDGFINNRQFGFSAEATADLGGAVLTVLPAYRQTDIHYKNYTQGFLQYVDNIAKQTSVETRLASDNDAKLKWILGGYFFQETQDSTLRVLQSNGHFTIRNPRLFNRTFAGFAQATYSLTDSLRLTGGVRYTKEKKTQNGFTILPFTGQPVAACVSPGVYDVENVSCTIPNAGSLSYGKFTWKGGVEFDAGPSSLIFVNVSKGFKAGGFFAGLAPNTYLPETLTSYEIGSKNRFFGNRLQVNVNAFYWDYKNQQVTNFGNLNPAGTTVLVSNADSHIYGIDSDIVFQPTSNDRFSASVAWTKGKFDRYTLPLFQITLANGARITIQPAADFKGRERPFTPEWSAVLRYDHTFDLDGGSSIVVGAATHIESASWLAVTQRIGERQPAYMMSDADITYNSRDGRWYLSAFIQNIENEAVGTQSVRSPVTTTPSTLEFMALRPPRTYGGRIGFKF